MHNEVEFKPGMQEMQCNVQKSIFIIHYSNIKKKKEPGDHLNVCRKKHLIKKKNFIIKTWQTSSRKGFTQSNVNSERLKTFSL